MSTSFGFFNSRQLTELHDRNRPDASAPITAGDLAEFLRNPALWRNPQTGLVKRVTVLGGFPTTVEDAQSMSAGAFTRMELRDWMQQVYDALGIDCEVPLPPTLTPKQEKSLKKYNLRLFYIPAITEAEYPQSFIKPAWGKFLTVSSIERKPLLGRWVAVEVIAKPNWNDPAGYSNDTLAKALKITKRFTVSWDDLHNEGGLLTKVAKITGLPKRSTRLPTAEEWNFLGNLFLWLNTNRKENLPDLGSTNSWEWTEVFYGSDDRVIVGNRGRGGLSGVSYCWHDDRRDNIAFRVLAVL